MSVPVLSWANRQHTGNGIATAVLRFLAWRWNESAEPACAVRLSTIAKETEFSKPTVVRALRLLESLNLLHSEPIKSSAGVANSYVLHLEEENVQTVKEIDRGKAALPINGKSPLPNNGKPPLPPNIYKNKKNIYKEKNVLSSPPDGVSEESWEAWKVICKAKRLWPKTRYSWNRSLSQMTKAGLTAQQGVDFCIERGWSGFLMDWYLNAQKASKNTHFSAANAHEEESDALLDLFRSKP